MTDAYLIEALLGEWGHLQGYEVTAFQDMRMSLRTKIPLTPRQRGWAMAVFNRLGLVEPSENLYSSGRAPRGRDVVTPEVLRKRPLRPPGK